MKTLNFFLLFIFLITQIFCDSYPSYRVVIDPGHGGFSKPFDDKWDPVEKKFLEHYNGGMSYEGYHEHKIVLQIALKVHNYLQLTKTEEGWKDFKKLIYIFSKDKPKRIIIHSFLTRDKNWDDLKIPPESPDINDPFRLYDFIKNGNLQLGRISMINSLRPHLVVSIHLNQGGNGHRGGMAAVLAPGYKTFSLLREISLKQKSSREFDKLIWSKYWLVNKKGWKKLDMALSDTWVYFHGYRRDRITKKPFQNAGLRHNMIQWRYKDVSDWIEKAIQQRTENREGPYTLDYKKFKPEGNFWEREKHELEYFRREKPLKHLGIKFGGDNHYSTDELLRFIQFGLRTQHKDLVKKNLISGIVHPFVSAYALPILVNAICAYLEIAHLDVKRDRYLVLNYQDTIASSLAVGIYSLFSGLKIKKNIKIPFKPRGINVDFNKYINHKDGNYFEKVVE